MRISARPWMQSVVRTNKYIRPWIIPSVLVNFRTNVDRELLVAKPWRLLVRQSRKLEVNFLLRTKYVLGGVKFLFGLASTYVVCFLEFKESKLIPPKK